MANVESRIADLESRITDAESRIADEERRSLENWKLGSLDIVFFEFVLTNVEYLYILILNLIGKTPGKVLKPL